MIDLFVAIQHHPARAELLPPLLERLPCAVVVTDPDPESWGNALRTYRECLRATPESATHVLIVQDDAWPCEGFMERATAAIAERADDVVCFFVPGAQGLRGPLMRAAQGGEPWAYVRSGAWVPTVATTFPRETADAFLDYISRGRMLKERGDDGPLTRFCRLRRIRPWATVPSLVQHEDRTPSLVGLKTANGANPSRVAAFYEGDPDPRVAPAATSATVPHSTTAA